MSPVDHVVTSGTFSLDGGTWDVDNNVWIVGDENDRPVAPGPPWNRVSPVNTVASSGA